MPSTFPTSLQDLDATRGTANQPLSNPSHVAQHTLEDQTIEALETKVGIDGSADTTTIDYKLKNAASINPGHKHSLVAGMSDVTITTPASGNGLFYDGSKWVNQDTNIADASTSVKGVTKLSTAPASATEPISVGDNDTRVPTQGENNALVGTSGTPATGNKYVTNDDTATAATANKVARRLAGGNITVVTETDGNNSTNAASTAYVDTGIVNYDATIWTVGASNNIRTSDDATYNFPSVSTPASYTKVKEILYNDLAGTIRVYYEANLASGGGSSTQYTIIYKNGIAVGTERTTQGGFYDDITVVKGDLLQLYVYVVYVSGTCIWKISNFRLKYDKTIKPNYITNTVNL